MTRVCHTCGHTCGHRWWVRGMCAVIRVLCCMRSCVCCVSYEPTCCHTCVMHGHVCAVCRMSQHVSSYVCYVWSCVCSVSYESTRVVICVLCVVMCVLCRMSQHVCRHTCVLSYVLYVALYALSASYVLVYVSSVGHHTCSLCHMC